MVNINCPIAKNLMPLHLDGNLYPDDEAALRMHLQSCPQCAEEIRLYQDAFDGLRGAKNELQSIAWPDISRRVIAGLPDSEPVEPARPRAVFRLRFAFQTAACLMIGALIGFIAFPKLTAPVPENAVDDVDISNVRTNFPELGMRINPLNQPLKEHFQSPGVMVTNVDENSPAAYAGIKQWDVITEINNCPIEKPDQLQAIFNDYHKAHKNLKFVIIHKDGKKDIYTIKLDKKD
ncbi:MAG: PDZ domain-containing protein [Planctomycetes bacterium]|nr:PDZ domain-containing protein [Planctomycetota bacterium]